MNDIERQELWVRLQSELADLCEARSAAIAVADKEKAYAILTRQSEVPSALSELKQANAIRKLLARLESFGENEGK